MASDILDQNGKLLLDALSAAMRGEGVFWQEESVSWPKLQRLARSHNVLPLLAQAVWDGSVDGMPAGASTLKTAAARITVSQAQRTGDFLLLYRFLNGRGLQPAVMKGIVCRALYPCPEQRPSVDEDFLVDPAEFPAYHAALLEYGLHPAEADADPAAAYEVTYESRENGLCIELHKQPFPPDSEAYGDCGRLFDGALGRTVELPIGGERIRTLCPTDHLLYLICHAYKHFLHSGVGIRQVCDIAMFIERFGGQIDWEWVVSGCAEIRIERFAAAMFRITERHLGFAMPAAFAAYDVDELPLLIDMLTGGLYGTEDADRLHSGSMTLDAVAAQKQGRGRRSLLASLFPSASSLAGRYPYLRRCPWLLPVAWGQRFAGFLKKRDNSAAATIRIGGERIELLKQYGVID